jgi:hypothetical protein
MQVSAGAASAAGATQAAQQQPVGDTGKQKGAKRQRTGKGRGGAGVGGGGGHALERVGGGADAKAAASSEVELQQLLQADAAARVVLPL